MPNWKNDGWDLSWKKSIYVENDTIILCFNKMVTKLVHIKKSEDIMSLLIMFMVWKSSILQ